MNSEPVLGLAQHTFILLTWFCAIVFILSGTQDLVYDLGMFALEIYRRVAFRHRERLTSAKLRIRREQSLAVMIPAWNEGDVIAAMVDNILNRVQYENYVIFVGVYPNDHDTNIALDRLIEKHSGIVKVVNPRPGPTCKADCLNQVYAAIEKFEAKHEVNFEILCMHDAEDLVHPYAFSLYNYLIPRVDAIQLPILPLPTSHRNIVHWIYADEFAESHLKDVPVREKLSGFVPFAGVGTGFSRRVFHALSHEGGNEIFNERTLTEDYSMSRRLMQMGFRCIFVNLVLADDASPWWTPLAKRPGFVCNWAYFPMDIVRSVRQKTRWIIGISLQEWQQTGWGHHPHEIEPLLKDRKVFATALASVAGYYVLLYVSTQSLGGFFPVYLLPLVHSGSLTERLIIVATILMLIRMSVRGMVIARVYGVTAALLSWLRMPVGNVINIVAAARALVAFTRQQIFGIPMRWDKTQHVEGVGELPTGTLGDRGSPRHSSPEKTHVDIRQRLESASTVEVLLGLGELSRPDSELTGCIRKLATGPGTLIPAAVAAMIGRLRWQELSEELGHLCFDREWIVRANAVRSVYDLPDPSGLIEKIASSGDRYTTELLVRIAEQDRPARMILLKLAEGRPPCAPIAVMISSSPILRLLDPNSPIPQSAPVNERRSSGHLAKV